MKNCLLSILILLLIISCNKDKTTRTPEEERILELAYSEDFSYPADFYYEVIDTGSAYYENTVSIKPINERQDIWIELNTNDKNEARVWSDESNAYSSDNRVIINEHETDKFFEFKRKNINYAKDIILSRVHKTSYFEPVLNHFSVSDSLLGKYNGEMNLMAVKELVEYLWSCGSAGRWHTKVLESQIKEFNDYYEQYIQSIVLIHGDFHLYDEIHVYDNYFTLNKSDRTLIVKSNEILLIQGIKR